MRRYLIASLVGLAAALGVVMFFARPHQTPPRMPLPLDIWFTADTSGRIEPCGCFSGQFGGLTRISTVLSQTPKSGLLLEIGNALAGTEDFQILQFEQLLQAEGHLGYHALNLGSREASLPADTLRRLAKDSPVTLLSANVLDAVTRSPVVTPWKVVDLGGLKIGLIGIVQGTNWQPDASVIIADAAESLRQAIPEVKEKADVLICLAFTDETGLEKLAKEFYEIPILLGGDVQQPSPSLLRINQSWILATTNQSRALGEFHTKWDPVTRTLAPATGEISLMHDRIPEDPLIAKFSQAYRKTVGKADLDVDHPGTAADAIPGVKPNATFVGSQSCVACHPKAFATWEKSRHAHAFESLVRKESDTDPSCIKCHVTGFGEPGGYLRSMGREKLVNVSCESCHGPASDHLEARTTAKPGETVFQKMRPVGPGQCIQCHHGEFSRPFKYEEFWEFIKHGKEGA